MTPSEFQSAPIRVLLPDGEQEVVGRLHAPRQLPDGWLYLVSIMVYRNTKEGGIEPAEYRMWLRPKDHLRPVDGAPYDTVPTERLPRRPLSNRSSVPVGRPGGCCRSSAAAADRRRASYTPSTVPKPRRASLS
ncbi:hypothetical protein J7I98_39630 [Streptomyces sp. ISL-98]|uniref:hypothetical protein n=1 Tax=Streptomyces sp. ISL-98 TaxID=2819192 RepID=UPI001BEA1E87|nr:hypothetical protein [Streptomyces sp. ISL-98]MBT2511773.1 hypothetical protein [Streptomyces sp. ISL-98]